MKIGIITFHFPYNCGAVLQCLALQTVLKKSGHDACVINYRPAYHQNRYVPLINPFIIAFNRFEDVDGKRSFLRRLASAVKGFLITIKGWKNYPKRKIQHEKFQAFEKKVLHLTPVYRTEKQLQKKVINCGLYISGSDQLWNAHITNKKFDPAYFLRFGPKEAGRITYAVGANFSEHPAPFEVLPELLNGLNAVALRELKCLDDIKKCAPNMPIYHTIDPTLLLQAKVYDDFICERTLETEQFIFTYTMPDESIHKVYNAAKLLSEKLGMKVIDANGNPSKLNATIKDHRICGPDEFLWYMKHAAYVITNSFHGTAFSVIMEKDFVVIPHSKTGNRVTELLQQLDLGDRCVASGVKAAEQILKPVYFDRPRKLLGELRSQSLNYLFDSIRQYGNEEI